MKIRNVKIALASLKHPETVAIGLRKVEATLKYATTRDAKIVCFPETYIPGLRGAGMNLPPPDRKEQERVLRIVRGLARKYGIAVIIGLERSISRGLLNPACVIGPDGCHIAHVPYGREQVLVRSIDLAKATRRYARNYNPRLYPA